jgi:hypothetical protein
VQQYIKASHWGGFFMYVLLMHMINRYVDTIVNVLLPIIIGILVYMYVPSKTTALLHITRNSLPDICWAYAFANTILIIWQRKYNFYWLVTCFIVSTIFELLQYYNLIEGTGDVWDVLVYLLGFLLSIFLNNPNKKLFLNEQE